MLRILFIGLLLFSLSITQTKAQNHLSAFAEISVLTCDAGNELYSTFGHSAIRIKDPTIQVDYVFNYGTFDFDTPNFYPKFIRGKLDYMLSISPFRQYIQSYKREKRGIREQVLNLNRQQKQNVYTYLLNNAGPENKFYRYDFFFDNCATRIADVLDEATEKNIRFGSHEAGDSATFRMMMLSYLQEKHWARFGINALIGLPGDKKISPREASFLPNYLETVLSNSEIKQNGEYKPLVKTQNTIYEPEKPVAYKPFFLSPKIVFWSLLLIIVLMSIYEFRQKKHFAEIDRILLFLFGLIGLLIGFMWFFTDHDAVVNNLNIVWAMPLHFIPAFLITNQKAAQFIKLYFGINALVLLLFLILYLFKQDFFDAAVLPLVLTLLLRSVIIYIKKNP
jgi:hypothetical protein